MKMHIQFYWATLILMMAVGSCSVEPEPINYGHDQCSFCKMNIVDKAHAAQNVSKKGKQFKYDAIECLIRDLSKKDESEIAVNLVADFGEPGNMIPAETAFYIISPNIKSPMGANLSALSEQQKAQALVSEQTGDLFDWDGVRKKITGK